MNARRLKKTRVAVIGSGLGGLAAAVKLAHEGCEVVVYEKNDRVGGKMNVFESGGYRWDTGPSLLTMPHVIRELFESVGENLEDHLDLVRLDSTCRYRWTDGTQIEEDDAFWKRPDVARFLAYAKGIYEISEGAFLRNDIADWWKQLHPANLAKLRHLPKIVDPRTMHRVVSGFFSDPHLVQLFDRFATYNGSSPYRTPAAFNIIPYVQAQFGGWYTKGGMYRIAATLETLAKARGTEFRFGRAVSGVSFTTTGYAVAVEGDWDTFDQIVCNKDALLACQDLIPREVAAHFKRSLMSGRTTSMSGFILFLGVKKKFETLEHHNVLFSDNYAEEFDDLFLRRIPADQPTVYICASSRTDPTRAPAGCDNWFVLVNTPPLKGSVRWSQFSEEYADKVLSRIEAFGFPGLRDAIEEKHLFTPSDFRRRYSAYAGAIYGFASHGSFSAFHRMPMSPAKIPGFHFVGGSTHPGGGVPLVLLGGRIVADKILRMRPA